MPSGLPARSVSGKGWSRRLGIVLRSALTAKANNLNPYDYLVNVLQNIARADTLDKIEALLPWNVE
jgi:hypothetical protein